MSKGLPNNLAAINQVLSTYKRNSKKENVIFDLSFEYFNELIVSNCFYCNSSPSNQRKNSSFRNNFKYTGIDKVDPSKGYTTDNCVPCCRKCNVAKNNMSLTEFIEMICRLKTRLIQGFPQN